MRQKNPQNLPKKDGYMEQFLESLLYFSISILPEF